MIDGARDTASDTSDSSTGIVRIVGPDERASTAVVLAVATASGTDPPELVPPLHEFVDPEALDRLVARGAAVSFDAYGYRIAADGDVIDVRRPPDEGART